MSNKKTIRNLISVTLTSLSHLKDNLSGTKNYRTRESPPIKKDRYRSSKIEDDRRFILGETHPILP